MPIDYKRYPWDWQSRIVPSVLTRANNCCENCGLKNGQVIWSETYTARRKNKTVYRQRWYNEKSTHIHSKGKWVKVVLTVAHLDHDEHNQHVPLERLRALCQRCHLEYDREVHSVRRKCHEVCNYPHCTLVVCSLSESVALAHQVRQLNLPL